MWVQYLGRSSSLIKWTLCCMGNVEAKRLKGYLSLCCFDLDHLFKSVAYESLNLMKVQY